MTRTVALLCFIAVSGSVLAQPMTGSACVEDSGSEATDKAVARALAKGQLSHELGAKVSAKTELKSVTTEHGDRVSSEDVITEQVTLSSQHTVKGLTTLESGYREINGQRRYCVTVSQQ